MFKPAPSDDRLVEELRGMVGGLIPLNEAKQAFVSHDHSAHATSQQLTVGQAWQLVRHSI